MIKNPKQRRDILLLNHNQNHHRNLHHYHLKKIRNKSLLLQVQIPINLIRRNYKKEGDMIQLPLHNHNQNPAEKNNLNNRKSLILKL